MMDLPIPGAASVDLRRAAHQDWIEAAGKAGLDLSGFDPNAPLDQRVSWALQAGLVIACVYVRFSSKQQHSTADQVRVNVLFAASNRMYVPPELLCVDEAEKGRRIRRDGLQRLKEILAARLATVMLVFKASRLFRQAYQGYQLIEQEVVEEGLRAVSVSQGIDTQDKKVWKAQIQLYGMLDDLLLDAIADHVREGQIGLFKAGYVTGALGIGFCREVVPGAPVTNRGLPRTRPAVDAQAADLIRQHATWLLQGMPLREGVKRWRAAGGPADPRSSTGKMTYSAYRRLFTNQRLIGVWEFGRKRNSWSSKRDYTRQVVQPDHEVTTVLREDLRILPDEVFFALEAKLAAQQTGPRGPRKGKEPRLHDLVTEVFVCGRCQRRFHVAGAYGQAMHCPEPDCPSHALVNRQEAVAAVAAKLSELLADDRDLVEQVVASTQDLDRTSEDDDAREVQRLEQKIRDLSNRINDLLDLAGQGSDVDRAEVMAKVRAVQAERGGHRLELTKRKERASGRTPVTAECVRQVLADLKTLLEDGAAGRLGPEAIYRAADLFKRLVGGAVEVVVKVRPGRKRGAVGGRFTPRLLATVVEAGSMPSVPAASPPAAVEVWLRQPPRLEAVAAEVRRLYEDERLGFRTIAKQLGIGCGNVYQSYRRHYEMQGLPVPPRRPRGRSPRST
jgi:DNA invertase Pin-like site-specific DNA recombinase